MHKKAHKNTKANTLYNLGMTESQIKELQTKELSAVSEIYVDMDGVLADFFGEWAKHWSLMDKLQILKMHYKRLETKMTFG